MRIYLVRARTVRDGTMQAGATAAPWNQAWLNQTGRIIRLLLCIWILAASVLVVTPVHAAMEGSTDAPGSDVNPNRFVYIVPIHGTIDEGTNQFLKRAFLEAEEVGAHYIVLDIDTFGGYLNEAMSIGPIIQGVPVPTVAFVHGNAFSAGSYLALSADQIVMQKGSAIGAAAIVDGRGNRVTDSKMVSGWVTKMRSAAEQAGRNPLYAEGMVDDQVVVEVPELGVTFGRGQLISFSAEEAVKVGYAEHVAADLSGVLEYLGVKGYTVVEMKMSLSEKVGRVLTNPVMQTLLLIAGIAGIIIEMLIPGFGLPGMIGLAGFTLYFTGNYVYGFAGVEHIVLFVAGIILLLIELFVPSFGILGILGMIAVFSGVVLSAHDSGQAILNLGMAFVVAIIIVVIVAKVFKKRGIWNRFILRDRLDKESGYISNTEHPELLGQTGVATSVLRPAGTAMVNGKRYDVVTNGEFIEAGTQVRVTEIDGWRIVVSRSENENISENENESENETNSENENKSEDENKLVNENKSENENKSANKNTSENGNESANVNKSEDENKS